MKQLKPLLTCLVALIAVTSSIDEAQSQIRSPFERVERSDDGTRIYEYPNSDFGRVSISFNYGYLPMNSYDWYNSPRFDSKGSSKIHFPSISDRNTGVFGFSFNFYATPWLEVCIPFNYTQSAGVLFDNRTQSVNSDYSEMWLSMTPNVKFSWMYNSWLHLYSRAGFGWSLGNRHEHIYGGNQINHSFGLAYQLSPLGIEMGRRVVFFAEAGFGTLGKVNAGLKIRFKKSSDDSGRGADDWYEGYL